MSTDYTWIERARYSGEVYYVRLRSVLRLIVKLIALGAIVVGGLLLLNQAPEAQFAVINTWLDGVPRFAERPEYTWLAYMVAGLLGYGVSSKL